MKNINSKEVARRLGVSERHARRLIDADDYRVQPIAREELLAIGRESLAKKCVGRSDDLDSIATAIDIDISTGIFREGPEIDRLRKILKTITTTASGLRSLAWEIFPE